MPVKEGRNAYIVENGIKVTEVFVKSLQGCQ